jgi:hypothetical protein
VTAIKPIENRRVRGVSSERYPLNEKCAHPECNEPTADPHHTFPRSLIGNSSWFVAIQKDQTDEEVVRNGLAEASPIPHVAGLCRPHHDDVEQHRAWIKLEDGEFSWYDRAESDTPEAILRDRADPSCDMGSGWLLAGLLNPQPGSREGKPKRKKHKGEARRNRTTISIRVPKDEAEDGAAVYDELMEQAQEKLKEAQGVDYIPTPYVTLVAALYSFLTA